MFILFINKKFLTSWITLKGELSMKFKKIEWKNADEEYYNKYREHVSTTEYGYIQGAPFFTIYEETKIPYLESKLPGFGKVRISSLKEGKAIAESQLNIFLKRYIKQRRKKIVEKISI